MGGSNDNSKAGLRRDLVARRAALAPADLARLSDAVCHRAMTAPGFRVARHVALYAPRPVEVDTRGLEAAAEAAGAAVYYPRCDGDALRFHRATRDTLRPGRYGVAEPAADAPLLDAAAKGIVVVVPGVAFDRRGSRLGSGLGYYDRTLPTFPGACRLGLTLETLLLDRVPTDPWDVPMHLIATEHRLLDVLNGAGDRTGDPAWSW